MANKVDRTELTERQEGYVETGLAAFKRISWGAVFGGLVIALVVHLMLSLLGLGVGLGIVDPLEEDIPFARLGIGALIWGIVSMLIALFAGGYVAGRLAGIPRTIDSVLHGLITFSLFTLVMFYTLTTTIGTVITGVGGVAGQTLAVAGEGVTAAIRAVTEEIIEDDIDLGAIRREARTLLRQAGEPDVGVGDIIRELFEDPNIEIDRENIINVIVARTDLTREEANRIADSLIQTYQEARREFERLRVEAEQQAREAADALASAASRASIFLFIGLILGAAVAAVGGKLGEPHDIGTPNVPRER
jgi:VIT1/CCC1 family predicted Fe2+/Mn2+ transporter